VNEVLLSFLAVLGVVGGGGGAVTVYVKQRGSRPSGWQVAVEGLKEQVDDLKVRISVAESRAQAAETRADEVVAENQGLKRTIAEQLRTMDALNGRIVQLLTAWPENTRPPAPNPAHRPYL